LSRSTGLGACCHPSRPCRKRWCRARLNRGAVTRNKRGIKKSVAILERPGRASTVRQIAPRLLGLSVPAMQAVLETHVREILTELSELGALARIHHAAGSKGGVTSCAGATR
jgi:hypothetical protein